MLKDMTKHEDKKHETTLKDEAPRSINREDFKTRSAP